MKCNVKINNKLVIDQVYVASSFTERLIGLMFKTSPMGKGLLIKPCNSIHTCFMKYPIDVIFIDKNQTVIKVIKNMRPWMMTGLYFKSVCVLEIPSSYWECPVKAGDKLEIDYV